MSTVNDNISLAHDILVVDDDKGNLKLLMSLLSEAGYKVRLASSGELALRSIQAKPPILILLDINLPDIDGYEICRRLKADKKTNSIPVVFITILENENDKIKGFQAGGADYITKPFNKEELLARVSIHSNLQLKQLEIEEYSTKLFELNKQFERESAQRKKADKDLADSEIRYRRLFETAQDAILILNGDTGQIIDANPFIKDLLGYNIEELLGKNLWEIGELRDTLASKISYQQLYESGYVRYDHLPLVAKDGTRIAVEVVANAYLVDSQRIIQCNIRDITERNNAEAKRAELESRAQVVSRLASVGEMASGIAHEINNPLTGVVGFAQLLAEREDLPEDVREQLKIIHEGGERVAKIIKGLLSFARQSKPKREYISINEVVEEVIKLRQYELKTSNIEVINRFDPELPWTMADSGQLQQIFINLVVNAEQEMSRAHGKGRLEIKTELAGDMIHISFKDDGPGIAKEHIERIFDPFFTTKEVGKGTGLGLSLSHGIIAEHGGRLYAESEPGKGATFVVELPVLAEEADVEEAKGADETKEVIKGRILVVDDEEVVRQYLNSVLTKMGHTVELATDGEKALELVKSTGYNLILSDMKMPGMDGKEFYRKVEEINPPLTGRLVFITGDVMGEDTRDFIRKTGAPYITKPFNAEQLHGLVNDIIGGSMK